MKRTQIIAWVLFLTMCLVAYSLRVTDHVKQVEFHQGMTLQPGQSAIITIPTHCLGFDGDCAEVNVNKGETE